MRKTFFLLSMVSAAFLFSCGNAETDQKTQETPEVENDNTEVVEETTDDAIENQSTVSIVGTWKMSDVNFGMEIPAGQEEMFNELMQEMIDNSEFIFNEDGTMTSKSSAMGQIRTNEGTYSLDGDKLTTIGNGKEDIITIAELTETKLVLEVEDQGSLMTMTFSR